MARIGDGDGDGTTDGTAAEAYTYHVELYDHTWYDKAEQAASDVGAVFTRSNTDKELTDEEFQQWAQKFEGNIGSNDAFKTLGDTGLLQATPDQKDQFASILGEGFHAAFKVAEGDADGDGTTNVEEVNETLTGSKSGPSDGSGGLGGLLGGLPIPELLPSIGPLDSKMTTLLVLLLALAVITSVSGS